VRIVQDVLDAQPAHPEAHRTLALILERLADVQGAMGRFDAADSSLHTAVDLYRMLAEEAPNDPGVQRQYAIGLIKLGDLLGNPNFPNKEQPDAALERYLAAKPILERIYTTDSSQTQTYRLLGLIYERIGTIHDAIGDHHAARAAFRQSMEIRAAYAKAHPTYLEAMRDLAIAHEKMGDVAVKLHKLQEAQQSYTQATDIFRDLWQRDAKNVQAQQSLAISYLHLGDLAGYPDQPNLGDPHGARRHYQEAQHLLQDLRRVDSTNARTVFLLDYTRKRIARVGG
jgi:tetratricopeptide (TPR) repeat protein